MPDRRRAEVIVDIKVGKIDLEGAETEGEVELPEEEASELLKQFTYLSVLLPKLYGERKKRLTNSRLRC